jgi:hypothetical protein
MKKDENTDYLPDIPGYKNIKTHTGKGKFHFQEISQRDSNHIPAKTPEHHFHYPGGANTSG